MSHHTSTQPLAGKRAAVMIGPLFEDSEATYPFYRLQEAGAEVELIGLEAGAEVTGKHGQPLTHRPRPPATSSADGARPAGDRRRLRAGQAARRRGREAAGAGDRRGRQAARLHLPRRLGPGLGRDPRRAGAAPRSTQIADDLRNAGAEWEDAEVVVDRNLVSSRRPPDLPAFMRELIGVAAREPVAA